MIMTEHSDADKPINKPVRKQTAQYKEKDDQINEIYKQLSDDGKLHADTYFAWVDKCRLSKAKTLEIKHIYVYQAYSIEQLRACALRAESVCKEANETNRMLIHKCEQMEAEINRLNAMLDTYELAQTPTSKYPS